MQNKKDLEDWYKKPDPWKYKSNKDDILRREKIINFLKPNNYERILDIGCGEGFVTEGLPGKELFGTEISDLAASRFPKNVKRIINPTTTFDLVTTMGTLYKQYDHISMSNLIKKTASKHILICGIKDWLIDYDFGKLIKETEFKYRTYTQTLKLYEIR